MTIQRSRVNPEAESSPAQRPMRTTGVSRETDPPADSPTDNPILDSIRGRQQPSGPPVRRGPPCPPAERSEP